MDQQSSSEQRSNVTQQDVAEKAGVSRAVVSYVVNNGPRVVSEETRNRVLKVIEELGYRPNKFAQGLKLQSSEKATGQIGILLGGTANIFRRPYYSQLLSGIYKEAHRRNEQVRLVTFINELKDPVYFNRFIHPEVISGLLLVGTEAMLIDPAWPSLYERIINTIDNVVSLEHTIGDLPAVIFDRMAAARIAVRHLAELGHTRIAYAGYADERYEGYQQTLQVLGLEEIPYASHVDYGTHTTEQGYYTAQTLLKQNKPPTAIFCSADEVAFGVLAALHDMGKRVPQDVALVSIDDLPMANMMRPALTTVNVPKESFGIYALQMLSMQHEHPNTAPASMVLPVKLIVRDSCGARLPRR